MEKVRIGNDLRVNFSVYRNGEPESFDGATNISTKIVNESYNKTIAHTYSIVDNVIQFNIDALELKQCGKCRVFISYTKVGDYTVDSPAFELVQYTEDTGGTEVIGIEIVKINISGDIGINRDGASAYEVWEAYPGNEGKMIEQYFEWLRENPTKVDTSRTITAGNGLTGGGSLTEDRTINVVNTDDSIVVSADGIKVDTQDTLTSDSVSKPLSANQGKTLQDNKAEKTRNIVAGDGLSGGGDLTADRTININPADDSLTVTADNIKVNTNNTLTSTSTTHPLSANQGKVLNEKVAQVETDLNENLEPALAEVLNNLHGRIVAFEQLIKAMIFRSMQIDNLDVVKNLTIHGSTNLFLTGVDAPVNLPDFAGQYYIDTANRAGYLALSESVWLKIADAVEVAANSADMVSIKNNQEPAMAEIINHLNARILALESIIKNGLFKNTQIDTADIVKSLNLYGGTNLILIRTVAPAEVPDFVGQTYVNTAAGVAYEAVGTTSVSHWKQKTN